MSGGESREKRALDAVASEPVAAHRELTLFVEEGELFERRGGDAVQPAVGVEMDGGGQGGAGGFLQVVEEGGGDRFARQVEMSAGPFGGGVQGPTIGSGGAAGFGTVASQPGERRVVNECAVEGEREGLFEGEEGGPAGDHGDAAGLGGEGVVGE